MVRLLRGLRPKSLIRPFGFGTPWDGRRYIQERPQVPPSRTWKQMFTGAMPPFDLSALLDTSGSSSNAQLLAKQQSPDRVKHLVFFDDLTKLCDVASEVLELVEKHEPLEEVLRRSQEATWEEGSEAAGSLMDPFSVFWEYCFAPAIARGNRHLSPVAKVGVDKYTQDFLANPASQFFGWLYRHPPCPIVITQTQQVSWGPTGKVDVAIQATVFVSTSSKMKKSETAIMLLFEDKTLPVFQGFAGSLDSKQSDANNVYMPSGTGRSPSMVDFHYPAGKMEGTSQYVFTNERKARRIRHYEAVITQMATYMYQHQTNYSSLCAGAHSSCSSSRRRTIC
ncbi:hypothetical protein DACRYDRAFT_113058 [Dacryopinax primogenitus]|uniref:Uncharacterized protein n=1 Tax=Dacryopinax primogenitus (strain DJM 731) TaxID=1858805 RepID=M5GGZ3_DACPD|nr:uncharacterized protein DACRYDRAFT_113058 [Dacryopinax primogenitus]EJU06338.1 hypothetical protein DACRYDRAFT_113058 [Dacryopinax primogenitus]